MRVLVIDDDPLIRAGCLKILEHRGITCTVAQNGALAVECVRRASFDAALLDLKMPGLSGLETLKILRDESPNTAVIIITGYASIDSAVEAVKAGAFDYLPKPFTPEVLTERLFRAVRAVRKTLEESLIRREIERKKINCPPAFSSAGMGRIERLVHGSTGGFQTPGDSAVTDSSPVSFAQMEADAIRNTLRRLKGNKTRAAEHLGVNRKTLREKMRKYGIDDKNQFKRNAE